MNIWDVVLTVLGWSALVAIIICVALVVWGIVLATVQATRKRLAARGAPRKTLSDEVVITLATDHANDIYKTDIFKERTVSIFIRGVKYGLKAKGK